jgi:hypothetical protein
LLMRYQISKGSKHVETDTALVNEIDLKKENYYLRDQRTFKPRLLTH